MVLNAVNAALFITQTKIRYNRDRDPLENKDPPENKDPLENEDSLEIMSVRRKMIDRTMFPWVTC